MKRTLLILGTVAIFTASFANANLYKDKPVKAVISFNIPVQESAGEKLINKSDCMGCHTKSTRIIGPSYLEIAKKYKPTPKNITLLSDKIIKGGTGVWGSLPMTAHADLSKADANAMVKYILSVKK